MTTTALPGNPFATEDAIYTEDANNSSVVNATLALAYEQRTANLIALYSMDESARQGMVDGAGLHSGNWVNVTRQIKERLGL